MARVITKALFRRKESAKRRQVEVAVFETMAWCIVVEHVNGAMFDLWGRVIYPRTVAPNRKPYRTSDEWLALFRELQIPAAPLQTPAELFGDPHLNAVDFFETLDTEHGTASTSLRRSPFGWTRTALRFGHARRMS